MDQNGLVTILTPGDVVITAAQGNVSDSVAIHISCLVHTPETDPAVPPTCTKTGLTEGSHCAVCADVLTAQEDVPALGHDWGVPTYEWAADDSAVTATRVCGRDEDAVDFIVLA